jgi:hypothetical protein
VHLDLGHRIQTFFISVLDVSKFDVPVGIYASGAHCTLTVCISLHFDGVGARDSREVEVCQASRSLASQLLDFMNIVGN